MQDTLTPISAASWDADGQLEVLTFDLAGETFAVEAMLVREILDLLPETSLAGSKREAREFLSNGSISINGAKVDKASALDRRLGPDDLLHGRMILVRRGKKTWHATRWS